MNNSGDLKKNCNFIAHEKLISAMKKFRLIIVAAVLIVIMAMGSCTHKLCPAYAKADTEQSANSG